MEQSTGGIPPPMLISNKDHFRGIAAADRIIAGARIRVLRPA
jgi:hypothetical protein